MSNASDLFNISYSDLERAGLPAAFIEDYQSFKRSIVPQHGTDADPNTIYKANLNGLYIKTNAPEGLWFNPTAGAIDGWIQIV